MLLFLIQWGGERYHPGPIDLYLPLAVLLIGIVAGVLLVGLLERVVPRIRLAIRASRQRRRRLREAAGAELRARAMMSELCPHGWRAEITLYEHPDADTPAGPLHRVKLEWTELRDESGTPAVMREVWAPSIGEALEAMVADRRTDETLEQIEQGAVAEGASWPDPE